MPKYYCDYCDVFLAVDSPSVRKMHNTGWKHKTNVRAYYGQFASDAMEQKQFVPTPQMLPPGISKFTSNLPGLFPPGFTPPSNLIIPTIGAPQGFNFQPPTMIPGMGGPPQNLNIRPPQQSNRQ